MAEITAQNKWEPLAAQTADREKIWSKSRTFAGDVWFRFRHKPTAIAGFILILVLALFALVGPFFTAYDYAQQNLEVVNIPPIMKVYQAPDGGYLYITTALKLVRVDEHGKLQGQLKRVREEDAKSMTIYDAGGTEVALYYGGSTYVVDAKKTVGTVATLNGAIGEYRSMPSQTRIDGTYVNDAWAFMQDYTAAHTITNSGSKYVFFYDTYGNVIGMVGYTDAKSYFVADSIYKTYETGTYTANAKLVNFEKEASDVKLSKVTNHAVNGQGIDIPSKGNALAAVSTGVDFKLDKAETPNTLYYGLIYSYVDGVLTREGQNTIPSGTNVSFTHAKNAAEIKGNVGFNWEYKLDENTKFLVKKVDGTFESYTGCTALPALTASVMDYVTADGTNNSYCTMVYLGGAVYGDESVTGYVATFQQHDWADGYERVTVYVAGEATVVLVPKTMLNATLSSYPAGVYTFATAVQKDGTVCATSITAKDAALAPITAQVVGFGAGVVTVVDTDSVALNQYTLSLKDVKIYDARGTVLTVIDAETLETAFNDAQGLVPAATVTVKIYSTGIAAIDGIYLVG